MTGTIVRKALAAAASAVVALGACAAGVTAAQAAVAPVTDKGDITINRADNNDSLAGRTFVGYRVLDYTSVPADPTMSSAVSVAFVTDNGAVNTAKHDAVLAGLKAAGITAGTDGEALDAVRSKLTGTTTSYLTADAGTAYTFGNAVYADYAKAGLAPDVTFTCAEQSCTANAATQYGYYLIVETGGTAASATENAYAASYVLLGSLYTQNLVLTAKSQQPTSEKYISKNDGSGEAVTDGTENSTSNPDFAEGEEIYYTLKYTIPYSTLKDFSDHDATFTYTLQDSLSAGITFDSVKSVTVNGTDFTEQGAKLLDPTAKASEAANLGLTDQGGSYLKWTVAVAKDGTGINGYAAYGVGGTSVQDAVVTVTYTCHMNENAIIASTGNPNSYNVSYTRNPLNSSDYGYTPQQTPRVYTYSAYVFKEDIDTGDPLQGVTFCLTTREGDKSCQSDGVLFTKHEATDASGATTEYYAVSGSANADTATSFPSNTGSVDLVTLADGKLDIRGLDDATTYYLYETAVQPNSSYTLLSDPVVISISAAKDANAFAALSTGSKLYYPAGDATQNVVANVAYSGPISDAQVIYNSKKTPLPVTGAAVIAILVVLGIALVGGGLFIIVSRNRRNTAAT